MTIPETKFNYGQQVIVLDAKGDYQSRGAIIGIHRLSPICYVVMPRGEVSLSMAIHDVTESRLRSVAKHILAYERRPLAEPKHIADHA